MKSDVAAFIVTALARQGAQDAGTGDLRPMTLSALAIDSLDFMELLNEIEEEFEVRIEDDTVSESTTVAELIAFVERKVAALQAAPPVDRS